ncbi:MAG: hypothetical protein RML56_10685 [Burkholderiales bacterium]|nr:hypothetical protein [Burkholderiales bacterium]
MRDRLCRLLRAQPHELGALAAAFAYFFLLLAAYYVLRPVRDALAVQAGAARLPWVLTAVFAAMLALVPLWGWLCARFARAPLLAATYACFALDLCAFWLALRGGAGPLLAGGFFVWVSVFNLFAVSVFWSFMADLFDRAQAARALSRDRRRRQLRRDRRSRVDRARRRPRSGRRTCSSYRRRCLRPRSAASSRSRAGRAGTRARASRPPRRRSAAAILAGARAALTSPFLLGIGGWLLCYTVLSTALYFQQVQIVGAAIADPAERTRLFAAVDLAVNALALVVQLGATARLTLRLGTGWMLALMPLLRSPASRCSAPRRFSRCSSPSASRGAWANSRSRSPCARRSTPGCRARRATRRRTSSTPSSIAAATRSRAGSCRRCARSGSGSRGSRSRCCRSRPPGSP